MSYTTKMWWRAWCFTEIQNMVESRCFQGKANWSILYHMVILRCPLEDENSWIQKQANARDTHLWVQM